MEYMPGRRQRICFRGVSEISQAINLSDKRVFLPQILDSKTPCRVLPT